MGFKNDRGKQWGIDRPSPFWPVCKTGISKTSISSPSRVKSAIAPETAYVDSRIIAHGRPLKSIGRGGERSCGTAV